MVRKIIGLALLAAIGLGLQACAQQPPSPQESCNFVQNGEQQRVSWGSQTPVVMYVDHRVPDEFLPAITAAAKVWNKEIGREVLKIVPGATTNGMPTQDSRNVIYFMKDWEREKANEQARTTVYWAGDRIYEADIRINGRDFEFFSGEQMVAGRVDMESLLLHELGHVLGLGHTDPVDNETAESVMVRSLPSATKRRELMSVDVKSIRCEY